MNICKCDVCSKFAAEDLLDTVTLTIRKHKDCDVNVLFGSTGGVVDRPVIRVNSSPVSESVVIGGVPMPDNRSKEQKERDILEVLKKTPQPTNINIGQ